jgi:hypothetical protein
VIQLGGIEKWQGQWFLHYDNAPSHTSLVVQQFLAEKNMPVSTQPPYFPDLAPSAQRSYFEGD